MSTAEILARQLQQAREDYPHIVPALEAEIARLRAASGTCDLCMEVKPGKAYDSDEVAFACHECRADRAEAEIEAMRAVARGEDR